MMPVLVEISGSPDVRWDKLARQTVEKTLGKLSDRFDLVVSVEFVGDRRMRPLNRRYLGKDRPTDVLSFPLFAFALGQPPADLPTTAPVLLGTVVVNLEAAQRQSGTAGHTLEREVQSLIEHGVRHLLGWHHGTTGVPQ